MPKTKVGAKKHPSREDLLAWWIFYSLDVGEIHATPEVLKNWIAEVLNNPAKRSRIHRELYDQYDEFKALFVPPE